MAGPIEQDPQGLSDWSRVMARRVYFFSILVLVLAYSESPKPDVGLNGLVIGIELKRTLLAKFFILATAFYLVQYLGSLFEQFPFTNRLNNKRFLPNVHQKFASTLDAINHKLREEGISDETLVADLKFINKSVLELNQNWKNAFKYTSTKATMVLVTVVLEAIAPIYVSIYAFIGAYDFLIT